jgi:hypothetical protein
LLVNAVLVSFCSLEVCSTGTLIVEALFVPICQGGIDGRPVVTPEKGDETGGIIVLYMGDVVNDVGEGEANVSVVVVPIELGLRLRSSDFNDLSSCCKSESDWLCESLDFSRS